MEFKKCLISTIFIGILTLVLPELVGARNEQGQEKRGIRNPSFEEGLDGWGVSKPSEVEAGADETIVHSGKRSAFARATNRPSYVNFWVIRVDVVPGETYSVSGFMRTELKQGQAYLTITFCDDQTGKSMVSYDDDVKLEGKNDWTKLSLSQVAPPGSDYLELHFFSVNFIGTIWCDDAEAVGRAPTLEDDKNRPYILGSYPPEGSTISWVRPVISVWYGDGETKWYPALEDPNDSGVNIRTVSMVVDGKDVTSQSKLGAFSIVYIPQTALSKGRHLVQVKARDRAGNLAVRNWSFTIDTNRPLPKPGEGNHNIWQGGKDIVDFCFIHISDTEINAAPGFFDDQRSEDMIKTINQLSPKPAFVINTGDIVDDGCMEGGRAYGHYKEQYRRYKEMFSKLTVSLFTVIGNHDIPRPWFLKEYEHMSPEGIHSIIEVDGKEMRGSKMFEHYIGPVNYSFDYGNWHFIAYDAQQDESFTGVNAVRGLGSVGAGWVRPETMLWVEEDLRMQKKERPTIIFGHQPLGQWRETFNEDQFLSLLTRFNVKAGFCGHGESYHQWKINGIQMAMTPSPSGKPHSPGGYITVQIKGDQIRHEVNWLKKPSR